jgi:hypothetical protein
MRRRHRDLALAAAAMASLASSRAPAAPMQIGFLWHMHQPIYYPGETITQTQAAGHYSFSLYDVHNQRFGPYTSWPKDAIQTGSGLPNLGASVSFSGSLIENLNHLKNAGVNGGMWNNWQVPYTQARAMNTIEGNTRLDLIGFNYHHALMPLLDERDMRMQIKMHKIAQQATFGSSVPYSKGFFPAETAFSERMIPALVAEGLDWTIVDNIHFDRATKNYPHTNNSGLYAPNRADQINPDPAMNGGAWLQLNNLWAPSKVSAPFSYRPHNVQYVNPNTGAISKIVAVPGARYEGNEDGRGGYGALQYQAVMDQYQQYNTDPTKPMLVVLHHDGDNYGGGSDGYYHHNFQQMVNWANGNPNYNVTTIADYLKKYPVATNDVIHVENGSWAGADNGDPEFRKWLGDPNGSGWSPDRNSWAVLTAAKNRVFTAEDIAGPASAQNVINKTGNNAEKAWHYLVQAEASDHWYWDGTQVWDSNVTRGSNLAVQHANQVISGFSGNETTPPTVFVPQRDSYNPGAFEFGSTPEPSDFKVWTYAYDVSGLTNVTLKWRTDGDGENPLASTQNETYAGGAEVGAWNSVAMTSSDVSPPANVLSPTYRALQYAAMINGQSNKLIDYYIEAIDAKGNLTRTDIQHVFVGGSTSPPPPPPGGGSAFVMDGALDADAKEIASKNGMKLYYSMHGGKLYIATNDAGEGSDHFIYLAGENGAGAMTNANWAKAGQIAQWAAFLADENNNDFEGWFDATGASAAATGANGGVLEGTIDLAAEFGGTIPADIYLAVGLYGSADGGTLLSTHQLPGTLDSDGNLQAGEYLKLTLPVGWALGGGGDWNTGWNWADATPSGADKHARLLNVIATPSTISSATNITVGHITFASPYGYTLAGDGAITFDVASGNSQINVVAGVNQINLPMTLSDNTIATLSPATILRFNGALNLSANVTLMTSGSGTTEINGPVTAGSGSSIRNLSGALDINVDLNGAELHIEGGVARINADQHLSALSAAGLLDMKDRQLTVDSSDVGSWNGSNYTGLAGLIQSGRGDGSWNGAAGIATTMSDATSSTLKTIAIGLDEDDRVLIKYTWGGDANLDGQLNGDDYFFIDSNVVNNGVVFGYQSGDFDYNGAIDGDDYFIIDSNIVFAQSAGPMSRLAPVPEPASAVALLACAPLLRRRKMARCAS